MLENFLLSLLFGVLLAVPANYLIRHHLLRRFFLRRHLRCIAPYQARCAEQLPGIRR